MRNVQIIPIELNLRKQKWLLLSIYKPPSLNNKLFLQQLNMEIREEIE